MWEYERRNLVLSQRELDLGARVSSGPMPDRFAACREILSYDSKNHDLLKQCQNCGDRYPCQIKYCDKCFNSPLVATNWRVDPMRFIGWDVVNPIIYSEHVGYGGYRHIQRVQNMMEPFYGLPVKEVAPITVKLCCLQGGEDYVAVKNFYQGWMREIATGFRDLIHADVKLVYRFEWSWTTAGNAKWQLPFRAPGVVDSTEMNPDQVVAFLHCHGLAHFPGFRFTEAGQFFRMVFDGPWQVYVSEPVPDGMVKVRTSDPSLITFAEPSSPPGSKIILPDHPDDAYDLLDLGSDNQIRSVSVDQLLDAMAAERHLDDEEDHISDTSYQDHAAGIAGFVNYICKEHLPKAVSGYQRRASINTSGIASDGSSSRHSVPSTGQEPDPERRLTPEQMVIACHGDAELKRAFHGRRLTHTTGTIKKQKSKGKKVAP